MNDKAHPRSSCLKRFLIFSVILLTLIAITVFILFQRGASNIKPIASIEVASDLRLDLVAVLDNSSTPVTITTPFTPLVKLVPTSLTALRHYSFYRSIQEFISVHSADRLSNPHDGTVRLYFLVRKHARSDTDWTIQQKLYNNKMHWIGGRFSNDPALYQSTYISDPMAYVSGRRLNRPYVKLSADLTNVSPFLPTLALTFQEYESNSTVAGVPRITIPNPYYKPATPLEHPMSYPASITHDGQTVTIHNLVTGVQELNLDHYSTTSPLTLTTTSQLQQTTAPPSTIALFTSMKTEDGFPRDWIIDEVTFSIGKEKIPFHAPRKKLVYNYEDSMKTVISYHAFPGDLSITTQPVCVSIQMIRDRNFGPGEADTVDIAIPLDNNTTHSGTIWQPDKPVTATVSMATMKELPEKYGDRQYLNVQYDPYLPPHGDFRIKSIAPTLTRADRTTVSLESYYFGGTPNSSYFDIHRLNHPSDTDPALNLDDFTTITVGLARRVPFPHTFDFILQPNKPQ